MLPSSYSAAYPVPGAEAKHIECAFPSRSYCDMSQQRSLFLSTTASTSRDRQIAAAVAVVSVLVFLSAAPFAKVPLAPLPGFIPFYQSALAINDLVTAVLLFGQFSLLRSRALLMLASAYLFTACLAIVHAFTFPGVFSPSGLLGAGPQTTAWMYMFWHGGFPLLVIAYALMTAASIQRKPAAPACGASPCA